MSASRFTKTERLDIGRRIYEKELNMFSAAAVYDINPYTARSYYRLYKAYLSTDLLNNMSGSEADI